MYFSCNAVNKIYGVFVEHGSMSLECDCVFSKNGKSFGAWRCASGVWQQALTLSTCVFSYFLLRNKTDRVTLTMMLWNKTVVSKVTG